MPKLLLRFSALGDVLYDRDAVERLCPRPRQTCNRQVYPDDRAVLADVALLHRIGPNLTGGEFLKLNEILFQVIGMGVILEGQLPQLVNGIAQNVDVALIRVDKAGGRDLTLGNPQRCLLEDRAETLLAPPQQVVRSLALGDIARDAKQTSDRARGIAQWSLRGQISPENAGRRGAGVLVGARYARVQKGTITLHNPRRGLDREQLGVVQSDHFLRRFVD